MEFLPKTWGEALHMACLCAVGLVLYAVLTNAMGTSNRFSSADKGKMAGEQQVGKKPHSSERGW